MPGNFEVSDSEKTFVKDHMIEVLIHCSEQTNLRAQALECVKLVINREYPLRWTGFLTQCLALVSSGDQTRVYCGLACLRVIAREFEMKSSGSSREPLEELIRVAMPGLLTLGEQLSVTGDQVVSATLLKFILKIFYSAVQLKLSPLLADEAVCTRWFVLCSGLTKIVPDQLDEEGVHAKLHKWAFRILHRFFARYGNPDMADSDLDDDKATFDKKKFAIWWLSTFAPPLVGLISEALKNPKISRGAKYQAISFLGEAIQHSTSYKALKPRLESILFEIIFPLMCFSPENDGELWSSDPEEFVRREFDCMYSFSDPKSAAVEFLKNLVSMRAKDSLGPLLKFCEMQLSADSSCAKDGALAIIGSIAPQLCVSCKGGKKKGKKSLVTLPNRSQLEALLSQYVLPDFGSTVGFLRYRACWVYQQFADEEFQFGDQASTLAAFDGFRKCLIDSELPVRVQAGCSLKSFINTDDFAPMIKPVVPDLLDKLLRLMHEVDCEALASTLEALVSQFADEVLPFAGQAVEQLGKVFVRLLTEAGEEDDEAQMACMGSIQTICTIMESATAPMYVQLEKVCYPILDAILSPEGLDYMEEGLNILTYLTFYCPEPLSPGLWKYYSVLHMSVCGGVDDAGNTVEAWGVDYLTEMLNVFDNFVSRTPGQFVTGSLNGKSYIEMLFEVCKKGLADDCETTQVASVKIAACVFESCPSPSVNNWLGPFLNLYWSKFSPESSSLNRWTFYLVVMMVYYDAAVVVAAAGSLGVANDLFASLHKLSKFAKSKDERKALCIAICGLIKRSGELGLEAHLKAYVEVLAVQTKELSEMRKRAENGEQEEDEEDEEEDDEDELEIQDLDENESADQSAKLRMNNRLREEIAAIREQMLGNESFEDEDDSDYDEEDDEEDCERISPLDAFCEFSVMKEVLTGLGSTVLLTWFAAADLMSWNQLLDENITKAAEAKVVS